MDLISRQAAINTVRNMKQRVDNIDDYEEVIVACFEALISPRQWIPCSERLPEEFEPVLGTFKFQGGNGCLTTERIVMNGEERWSAACGMTPIAWMPLPEPYKEEE